MGGLRRFQLRLVGGGKDIKQLILLSLRRKKGSSPREIFASGAAANGRTIENYLLPQRIKKRH
jgi:hypothetical protein